MSKFLSHRHSRSKILLFLLSVLMFTRFEASAQAPVCTSTGLIYYLAGGIYMYDPTQPLSATNPSLNTITPPAGANGLAVSPNLNGGSPSPTFYTCVNNNYYYYNGAGWTNTGHSVGNAAAVNPGAGGGYIYNLVGLSGDIYVYNGTGNGTLLTTVTGFGGGGPYDLQVDCAGNFYILNTSSNPTQYLRKYNPAGVLLQSWTLTGAPNSSAGGGMGIIGNQVIYNNTSGLLVGTIGTTNVAFSTITAAGLSPSPSDFGSCPLGGLALPQKDTQYYCAGGPPKQLSAFSSTGPFTWSVLNGPAIITGSGQTVSVTATGNSTILSGSAGSQCGPGSSNDTIALIVVRANVSAGINDTALGCGVYADTLHGNVQNTTPGITYSYAWSPTFSIVSGTTSLSPIIAPTSNTTYVLSVSTPANRGACLWKDSVEEGVIDRTVTADYSFDIHYGCSGDSVHFTNLSSPNTSSNWDFNNNAGDTARNPVHIYSLQNAYNVRLIVANNTCRDTVTKVIDTNHPLAASFTKDHDSACQQQTINFTNTSLTTIKNNINPQYFWIFGDGGTSTLANPTYTYTRSGVYNVKLIVTDFVPCVDTSASQTVVIDSIPFVTFAISDSTLCVGQGIKFTADYLLIGNTGLTWNFGDGTQNINLNPISHAFDQPGAFEVKLTSHYRLCPDTSYTKDLVIKPVPNINIGPDTVLCPGGQPIVLMDHDLHSGIVHYKWSTGDTTAATLAHSDGGYWAKITEDGCTSSDSLVVGKDCYIDIPNSFTPNGDGLNDYFLPRQLLSRSATVFKMTVYNRWGAKVFETTSIDGRGWDGRFNDTEQPQGVYVYIIDAQFRDGSKEHYVGNVTLIR